MDRKSILLVEDEAIIAMDEARMLESHGFYVVVVHNASDAIDKVNQERVDLVLMDIDLGSDKVDGTIAAQNILKHHRLPIVFLTSHSEREMVERVKGITRYGYILKNSGEFVLIEAINMAFELFFAHEKTIESEEKYRAAFMTSPDSININRLDGLYIDINEGFTALTGYTREDVIGKLSSEIEVWAIPEDREKLVEGLEKNGVMENLESIFRCKDGTLKTGLMSARVININNEPHILSVTRDITKKKEIEERVKSSEERFKSIFDNAADGILIGTNDGYITDANISMSKISGYSIDELTGSNITLLFPDTELKSNPLRYDRVHAGETVYMERFIKKMNGETVPVIMNTSKAGDNCLQAIFHDVSNLRAAQHDLRESEERFRLAVEGSRDGLWDWNLLTNDTYHSERFATMLGYHPDELPYTSAVWSDLVHPDDLEDAYNRVNRYLEGETDFYESTFRMRAKDGTYRWITGRGKALFDEPGKGVRFVGFNTDITEQKEREEKIEGLLQEKEFLLKEINHRVKNNLAMVSSFINLKQSTTGDKIDLSDLKDQVNAIRIVHEKLYYSDELTSINLREYVEELLEEIFSTYPGDRVRYELNMPDINFPLGIAIPLGLILNEIATNAMKHGFIPGIPPEFKVQMSMVDGNDEYTISMSNNGSTFPENIDIHNQDTLGLRLLHALTEQVGGTLELQKKPLTTFSLRLSLKE